LRFDWCDGGQGLSFIDALFTSTSAICVTGLTVVDTGSYFTAPGQGIILLLIQLGGLGIMTYTSLMLYLLGRRVSLGDRMAVGLSLLHDPRFSLRGFLFRVLLMTLAIEGCGALALWLLDPSGFSLFSAVFHSVSAYCNAGFSLFPDSLVHWQRDWGVNVVFMVLITAGGLGFYVLNECARLFLARFKRLTSKNKTPCQRMSWHTRVVLNTSFFLVVGGTIVIFFAELAGGESFGAWKDELLMALFQSVTCRTAGFNTMEIAHMTNVSLVFMLFLMLVGGSPGSCAGGIKTTTIRALWSFIVAQFKGSSQTRIGRFALSSSSMNKAFTLVVFAGFIVAGATVVLNISEGGDIPHIQARGHFLETLFEVISAYGTVGLSTGLTGSLSPVGKVVVILLMFVGRLGPMWLLSALQSWQAEERYRVPEQDLPLG